MIRIEFSDFHDLVSFINLFEDIDYGKIKKNVKVLNSASDKLIEAEQKAGEKDASTGSK